MSVNAVSATLTTSLSWSKAKDMGFLADAWRPAVWPFSYSVPTITWSQLQYSQ